MIVLYSGERLEATRKRSKNRKSPVQDISKDNGCKDGGPSCLKCWLPQCIFDVPPAKRAEFRARFLLGKSQN